MFKALKEPYWRVMSWNLVVSILVVPLAALYLISLVSFNQGQLNVLIPTLFWLPTLLYVCSSIQHRIFLGPLIRTVRAIQSESPVGEPDLRKCEFRALLFPYLNFLGCVFWFFIGGLLLVPIIRNRAGLGAEDAFFIYACATSSGTVAGLALFYVARSEMRKVLRLVLARWENAPEKPSFFMPISVKLTASFIIIVLLLLTFLAFLSFVAVKDVAERERRDDQTDVLMALGSVFEKLGASEVEELKPFLRMASSPGKNFCVMDQDLKLSYCSEMEPSPGALEAFREVGAAEFIHDKETGWRWAWRYTANGRDRILSGWEPRTSGDVRAVLKDYYFKVAAVALLIGLGLGILASFDISRPLKDLSGIAVKIAEGSGETEVKAGGDDEMGILGRAFNRMTRVLLSQLRGELDRGKSLMVSIREAVENLAPMSQEMVVIAGQQASGSMRQASSAEEAAATGQEVASVSKQIAQNAQDVSDTAENSLLLTEHGMHRLSDTMVMFNDINQKMQNIAAAALKVGGQSKEVGSVVKIIEEISEQTSLLSLNAAIEAAGAGEAGLRFGVVAQEIQRLARTSAESTKRIREIIGRMQSSITTSIMQTEEGDKAVNRGKRGIDELEDLFKNIYKAAGEATNKMKEVNLMTSQQATASDQMALTMAEVKETANQSSTSAGQLKSSVAEIEKIVLQLKTHLEKNSGADPFL